jgi:probable HAF family extracellular repeat protein
MRASLVAGGIAVVLSTVGARVAVAQAPRYVATDLGDLGGGEAVAASINDSGQVAGTSWLPGHTPGGACGERRAFLWENGVIAALPSLPGTRFGFATDINDLGDVSGNDNVYVPDPACTGGCFPGFCEAQTPVLRSDGVAIDLSEPAPTPWYAGVAFDVNNARQVVGWSRRGDLTNPRTWHGFLWEDGTRSDLDSRADYWSIGTAINDSGLVVGYAQGPGVESFGFAWSGGTLTPLPALQAADRNSGTNDVNASGDAVGWSGPSTFVASAVFYPASGGVVDLGSLGGTQNSAYAMNDNGDAVGYSSTGGDQERHAVLWRSGQIYDLNDLIPAGTGWELVAAVGINTGGAIVGYGCRDSLWSVPLSRCLASDGSTAFRRPFLLTPTEGSIGDLIDLVRSFDLPLLWEIRLLAELYVAQLLIDAGYPELGCTVLRRFGLDVETQRGTSLTGDEADQLLQNLAFVREDVGCS